MIYRCSTCSTNWPHDGLYATCPECQEPCSPISNAEPIDKAEAVSRANHAAFERFYAERELRLHREALDAVPTAKGRSLWKR